MRKGKLEELAERIQYSSRQFPFKIEPKIYASNDNEKQTNQGEIKMRNLLCGKSKKNLSLYSLQPKRVYTYAWTYVYVCSSVLSSFPGQTLDFTVLNNVSETIKKVLFLCGVVFNENCWINSNFIIHIQKVTF